MLKVTDSHLGKFETISGKIVDLNDPKPDDITSFDIAASLSRIIRFNGHIEDSYTVAHHSILMSYLVPDEFALHALLHDSTEAYLGDVISPLKQILGDTYRNLENIWEKAVFQHYNLCPSVESYQYIKDMDRDLLNHEYAALKLKQCKWYQISNIDPHFGRRVYSIVGKVITPLNTFNPLDTTEVFVNRLAELVTLNA